jgi:hypothetical protein
MAGKYSSREFAFFIRQKWPKQTAQYDDDFLVTSFVKKHPRAASLLEGEDFVKTTRSIHGREDGYTGEDIQPRSTLREFGSQLMGNEALPQRIIGKVVGEGSFSDTAKTALDAGVARNTAGAAPSGIVAGAWRGTQALVENKMRDIAGLGNKRPVGESIIEGYRGGAAAYTEEARDILPQPEGEVTGGKRLLAEIGGGVGDPIYHIPIFGQATKGGMWVKALKQIGLEVPQDVAVGLLKYTIETGKIDLTAENLTAEGLVTAGVRTVLRTPSMVKGLRAKYGDAHIPSPDAPSSPSTPPDLPKTDADIEALIERVKKAAEEPDPSIVEMAAVPDKPVEAKPQTPTEKLKAAAKEAKAKKNKLKTQKRPDDFDQYWQELNSQEGREVPFDEARQLYDEDFGRGAKDKLKPKKVKKGGLVDTEPYDPYARPDVEGGGEFEVDSSIPETKVKKGKKAPEEPVAMSMGDPPKSRLIDADKELDSILSADPATERAPYTPITVEQKIENLKRASDVIRQRIADREMVRGLAVGPGFFKYSEHIRKQILDAAEAANLVDNRDFNRLAAYERRIDRLAGQDASYVIELGGTLPGWRKDIEQKTLAIITRLERETPYGLAFDAIKVEHLGKGLHGQYLDGVIFLNADELRHGNQDHVFATMVHELRHAAFEARMEVNTLSAPNRATEVRLLAETEAQAFVGERMDELSKGGKLDTIHKLASAYEHAATRLKDYALNWSLKGSGADDIVAAFSRESRKYIMLRDMMLGRMIDKVDGKALPDSKATRLPASAIEPGLGADQFAGPLKITAEAEGWVDRSLLWGLDPELPGIRYERTIRPDLVRSIARDGYDAAQPIQIYIRPGNKVTVMEGNSRIRALHAVKDGAPYTGTNGYVHIQFLDGAEVDYRGPLIRRPSSALESSTAVASPEVTVFRNSPDPGPKEITAIAEELTLDVGDLVKNGLKPKAMSEGPLRLEVNKDGKVKQTGGTIEKGQPEVKASVVFKGGGEAKLKNKAVPKAEVMPASMAENSNARAVNMIPADLPESQFGTLAKVFNESFRKQLVSFEQIDSNPGVVGVLASLRDDFGWKMTPNMKDGQQVGWTMYKPKPKPQPAAPAAPPPPPGGRGGGRGKKRIDPVPKTPQHSEIDARVDRLAEIREWQTDKEYWLTQSDAKDTAFNKLKKALPKGARSVVDDAQYLKKEWIEVARDVLKRGGYLSHVIGKKVERWYFYQTVAEAEPVYWIGEVWAKEFSLQERELVRDIRIGKVTPDNPLYKSARPEIHAAVEQVGKILDTVIDAARMNGVENIDDELVRKLKNFFPTEDLGYDPQYRQANVKHGVFSSSLTFHRDPLKKHQYVGDPAQVLLSYVRRSYQKIGEVREFTNDSASFFKGNKAKGIVGLLEMSQPKLPNGKPNPAYAATAGDDAAFLTKLVDDLLFNPTPASKWSAPVQKLVKGTSNAVTGGFLGLSGIINRGQTSFAGVLYDFKHLARIGNLLILHPRSIEAQVAKKWVTMSGALTDSEAMAMSFRDAPLAKFTHAMLSHDIGIGKLRIPKGARRFSQAESELWNRSYSALAASQKAEETLSKLIEAKAMLKGAEGARKLKLTEKIVEHSQFLKKHGVDVEASVKNGQLSTPDMLNVMLVGSNEAQHWTDPLSTPAGWVNPGIGAQVATKFMKYPDKQFYTLKKLATNPDLSKVVNTEKVLKWFTVGTLTYSGAYAISEVIRGGNPLDEGAFGLLMKGLMMNFLLDTVFFKYQDMARGGLVSGLPHARFIGEVGKGAAGILEGVFGLDPAHAAGAVANMLGSTMNMPGSRHLRKWGREQMRDDKPSGSLEFSEKDPTNITEE